MNKKNIRQPWCVFILFGSIVVLAFLLSGCNLAEGLNVPVSVTALGSVTATSTTTETDANPTETLAPTETPSLGVEAVITASSMWVRSGPGTDYVMIDGVRKDDEVSLIGRTVDSTWLLSERGWLFGEYVESESDLNALPVLYDFESDTPTLTPIQPTPEPES